MAKRKKKIVKPNYVAKAERAKKAPKKPIAKELKYGLIFFGCALVLAIILYFALYSDGSLPVKDGMPVMDADNWIVSNAGTSSKPKYFKIGEVKPLDGYALSNADEVWQTGGRTLYMYDAEDETQRLASYYVTGIGNEPATLVESAYSNYQVMLADTITLGDIQHEEIGGRDAHFFITQSVPAEELAEAADGDESMAMSQQQQMIGYFPAIHNSTILISLTVDLEDGKEAATQEELIEMMERVLPIVTFDEKK